MEVADNAGLRQFARSFGLLGYVETHLDEARRVLPPHHSLLGDPLPWIRLHARTVRLVSEAAEALKDGRTSVAERFVRRDLRDLPAIWSGGRRSGPYNTFEGYDRHEKTLRIAVGIGSGVSPYTFRPWGTIPPQRQLADFFSAVIQLNLRGVRRVPIVRDHEIGSRFVFPALITVLYWHALEAAEKRSLRRCEECSGLFFSKDARERFCPGEFGKESRCGARFRQRARRSGKHYRKGGTR